MTTPDQRQTVDEPRRATEHEIRTARAYVDETMPGWTRDSDSDRQAEYEQTLDVLIFAHGGRYGPPVIDEEIARAAGWVRLGESAQPDPAGSAP